jgi:type VI secretion system protein ImpL
MYRGEELLIRPRSVHAIWRGLSVTWPNERRAAVKATPTNDYNNLKTYRLLKETERLKEPDLFDFQVGRLTQMWAEVLVRTSGGVSEQDLKAKIQPHVRFFVLLQRDGQTPGLKLDQGLVDNAVNVLSTADRVKAWYELFVWPASTRRSTRRRPSSTSTTCVIRRSPWPPCSRRALR